MTTRMSLLQRALSVDTATHVRLLGTATPLIVTRDYRDVADNHKWTLPRTAVPLTYEISGQGKRFCWASGEPLPHLSTYRPQKHEEILLNEDTLGATWRGLSWLRPDVTVGHVIEHCPDWRAGPEWNDVHDALRALQPDQRVDENAEGDYAYLQRMRAARKAREAPRRDDALRRRDEVFALGEGNQALTSIEPGLTVRERRYVRWRRYQRANVPHERTLPLGAEGIRKASLLDVVNGDNTGMEE